MGWTHTYDYSPYSITSTWPKLSMAVLTTPAYGHKPESLFNMTLVVGGPNSCVAVRQRNVPRRTSEVRRRPLYLRDARTAACNLNMTCPTIMKIGMHKSPISTFVETNYAVFKLLMRTGVYRHGDVYRRVLQLCVPKVPMRSKVKFYLSIPWRHIGGAEV